MPHRVLARYPRPNKPSIRSTPGPSFGRSVPLVDVSIDLVAQAEPKMYKQRPTGEREDAQVTDLALLDRRRELAIDNAIDDASPRPRYADHCRGKALFS